MDLATEPADSNISPDQLLAIAVIKLAVHDLFLTPNRRNQYLIQNARWFFNKRHIRFQYWCDVIGVNTLTILSIVDKMKLTRQT